MTITSKHIAKAVAGLGTALTGLFLAASTAFAQGQQIGLEDLDPLKIAADEDINKIAASNVTGLDTPGGILTRVLLYLFPLVGIVLFVMIIWGGFEILSGATTPKAKENGKQRITNGLIGFIILFSAYWIAQLIQVVFGIQFLSF